jgi:hypothetical protein
MSVLFFILKAANTSHNSNDIKELVFCDSQWDIGTRLLIKYSELLSQRLKLTTRAKSNKPRQLMDMGAGLGSQDIAGWVFALV